MRWDAIFFNVRLLLGQPRHASTPIGLAAARPSLTAALCVRDIACGALGMIADLVLTHGGGMRDEDVAHLHIRQRPRILIRHNVSLASRRAFRCPVQHVTPVQGMRGAATDWVYAGQGRSTAGRGPRMRSRASSPMVSSLSKASASASSLGLTALKSWRTTSRRSAIKCSTS